MRALADFGCSIQPHCHETGMALPDAGNLLARGPAA